MPEVYDFSELRKYLRGQIDMGESDICLDEPWTLVKPQRRPASAVRPVPPAPAPQPASPVSPVPFTAPQAVPANSPVNPPAGEPLFEKPASAGASLPSARPVSRKAPAAYESAESLDAFYGVLKSDVIYASVGELVRYEGPAHPKVLLLLPAPAPEQGPFFSHPVGEMLSRLFESLGVGAASMGVTYFYKGRVSRNIPALLETSLRKMLTKELSFIAPSVMVSFGDTLFHQLFGKGKNFDELAGTDLSFSGIKTCPLIDAFAMSRDKQLKWVTWKVHIPRSSYFKA